MADISNIKDAHYAARALGVSVLRVRKLARDGRIGTMLGGRWVFTTEELTAFKRIKRKTGPPAVKISDRAAKAIRKRRKKGATYQSIADQYGVSLTYIAHICAGRRKASA